MNVRVSTRYSAALRTGDRRVEEGTGEDIEKVSAGARVEAIRSEIVRGTLGSSHLYYVL